MEKALSWNDFQKANTGRSVTVEEWREHKRSVLSKRPMPKQTVLTVVESVSSDDEEVVDVSAKMEKDGKRQQQAKAWGNLFKPPAVTSDSDSAPLPCKPSIRGRPRSGHGSRGGLSRVNARDDSSRALSKAARSQSLAGHETEDEHHSKVQRSLSAPRPDAGKRARLDWTAGEFVDILHAAYEACTDGPLGIRESARIYGVPFSVLQRRVDGKTDLLASAGRSSCLPKDVEQQLHDHILKLADLGFGVDWGDVRALAVRLGEAHGLTSFVAGGGWLDGFKSRFVDLTRLRTAALERNRMGALNESLVDSFYSLLEKSIQRVEELSGGKKLTPNRVLNVDEIGFTLNMTAGYVVTRKNSRHAHAATDNSRDHVSVASTIAADGRVLPNFYLLPGKRVKTEYVVDGHLQGTEDGSAFVMTDKGYMTDDAYGDFAKHLVASLAAREKDEWVLLVCDGYNSHAMLPDVLQFFWDQQIYVISFPSHTSSELQPLDITCFRPVKACFRKLLHERRMGEGIGSVNKWTVPGLISAAFKDGLSTSTVKNGFCKAGIHPFDREWVNNHKHVFAVSGSLERMSPGDEAVHALRVTAFDQRVERAESTAPTTLISSLNLEITPGQGKFLDLQVPLSMQPNQATADAERPDIASILVLPKPVQKKSQPKPRRVNAIGESFSAAKQLNEPERIQHLTAHKRKSEELHAASQKRAARRDGGHLAYVLWRCGYLPEEKSTVTVAVMKTFLRENAGKIVMPRSATHAKKEDLVNFLTGKFDQHPLEFWVKLTTGASSESQMAVADASTTGPTGTLSMQPRIPLTATSSTAGSLPQSSWLSVPSAVATVPLTPPRIINPVTSVGAIPPRFRLPVPSAAATASLHPTPQLPATSGGAATAALPPRSLPGQLQAVSAGAVRSCCKPGCGWPPALVLRPCRYCDHRFHHMCTTDADGKVCACCQRSMAIDSP